MYTFTYSWFFFHHWHFEKVNYIIHGETKLRLWNTYRTSSPANVRTWVTLAGSGLGVGWDLGFGWLSGSFSFFTDWVFLGGGPQSFMKSVKINHKTTILIYKFYFILLFQPCFSNLKRQKNFMLNSKHFGLICLFEKHLWREVSVLYRNFSNYMGCRQISPNVWN